MLPRPTEGLYSTAPQTRKRSIGGAGGIGSLLGVVGAKQLVGQLYQCRFGKGARPDRVTGQVFGDDGLTLGVR